MYLGWALAATVEYSVRALSEAADDEHSNGKSG